jgi:hypothetical protein
MDERSKSGASKPNGAQKGHDDGNLAFVMSNTKMMVIK